jgi:hypothetical protein
MGVWWVWAEAITGLDPHWSGCLLWDLEDTALDAFVRDHGATGYAIHMVDRDTIRRIEPALVDPPTRVALAEAEGFIESGVVATALRAAAVEAGASLGVGRVEAVKPRELRLARCLVPECDGVSTCHHRQEGLWARCFTVAPRLRTLCEQQYSDRRRRSRN